MKPIARLITNICSDKLPATRDFYTQLFDFQVAFDSDWFIQLTDSARGFELGIIDRNNDLVPPAFQHTPNGFYLTFVVDNTDEVYEIAKAKGFDIIREPEDTFYGQRRLLLKDPSGTLVDVSSLISNFQF